MALTRVTTFGMEINTTRGVAETLAATDYAFNVRDVSAQLEQIETERLNNKPTLTPEAALRGPAVMVTNVTAELTGGDATTAPSVGTVLRGCGMKRVESGGTSLVKKITVGAVSGGAGAAFKIGQVIGNNTVQGSATATGRVLSFSVVGSTNTIWYEDLSGEFSTSDTVYNYGASPQASATVSANPAPGGHAFRPFTDVADAEPDATVEVRDGEQVMRSLAMGSARFTFEHGQIPTVSATFRGPAVFNSTGKDFVKAGFVANVTLPPRPAGVLGDVVDSLEFDGFTSPVMTRLNIDLGQTVADRATIASGGVIAYVTEGLRSGYAPARITDRRPTADIDPDLPAVATYDMLAAWQSGKTFQMAASIGALRAAGQSRIVIFAPKAQFAGNASRADANGLVKINGQLRFTGDNDDEITIAFLYA